MLTTNTRDLYAAARDALQSRLDAEIEIDLRADEEMFRFLLESGGADDVELIDEEFPCHGEKL